MYYDIYVLKKWKNKENLMSCFEFEFFSNFSHFLINIIISYLFFSYNQGNVLFRQMQSHILTTKCTRVGSYVYRVDP